jgi:hypothetical protein
MGNHPSIKLDCQVENDSYDAGDTLKGNVHLSVVGGGEPVDYFDAIVLTLGGVEFVVVETDEGSRIDRTNESRFKLQTKVARFESGKIHPGEYDFPYEILLPDREEEQRGNDDGALTSGYSERSDNSFRKVSYKLRATLRRKKNVPRTSDNNIWADAVCRKRVTPSSSSSSLGTLGTNSELQ